MARPRRVPEFRRGLCQSAAPAIRLKWQSGSIPNVASAIVACGLATVATSYALRARLRDRVSIVDLALRVPAAGFFFVLLGTSAPSLPLMVYAVAFAPPYLALVAWRPEIFYPQGCGKCRTGG